MLDLWAALWPGEPGETFPASAPTIRIDYAWLSAGSSGVAPIEADQILDLPVDGTWGSDHRGLRVLVGW